MKKLKLQVQISIDGFIAGPNGEMDWMVWDWDDELKKYVTELTDSIDCIILGRKLAEGFIPYWKNVASDPSDPQHPFGKIMSETQRVVFSKTLKSIEWNNAKLVNGELSEEIKKLKNQNGKDIIAYGGGTFVSALIKEGLIDEFHLFVNPVAIGNGMPIFMELKQQQNLTLVKSQSFVCGITILYYKPTKG